MDSNLKLNFNSEPDASVSTCVWRVVLRCYEKNVIHGSINLKLNGQMYN